MTSAQTIENDIFIRHYSSLRNTLTDINNLLPFFVQEKNINISDVEEINAIAATSRKVEKMLSYISGPLTAGDTKEFHMMLTIMKEHGNHSTKDLSAKMGNEMASSKNKREVTKHVQLAHENVAEQAAQLIEPRQIDHSILSFPIIRIHFATIVLCVATGILTMLFLQSYYTTPDHNFRHHFTELLEINNEEIIAEIDDKINRSSNNTQQIIHELQQQNALLQEALNKIMEMTFQQHASYAYGYCKNELRQARLDIEVLQNDFNNKLTETESKLKQLLSLSEAVYNTYKDNHSDELWPLILFMSNEIPDQVAPAVILKMSDFAKFIINKEWWYSNSFFAFQRGYQMELGVYAAGFHEGEGTHVSVYLHLMKGPHDDELEQSGHWPLRGIFTIELLNQLSDNNHYIHKLTIHHYICSKCTNRVLEGVVAKTGFPESQFISHESLLHQNNSGYYINSSLIFRISYEDIEPPYQVAPVTLKVTHFLSYWLKNKEMWLSGSFFAFEEGYQMVFKVHASGNFDGEGTHVSVYLHLIKGPYDNKLRQSGQWPLRGTFTIELLSQLNDNHHYSDTLAYTPSLPNNVTDLVDTSISVGYGISQFTSHDTLHKYLKNDTAYFRISYHQSYQDDKWVFILTVLVVLTFVMVSISLCICLYMHIYR